MLWVELTFAVKFCAEFVYPMMMRRTLVFRGKWYMVKELKIPWVCHYLEQ